MKKFYIENIAPSGLTYDTFKTIVFKDLEDCIKVVKNIKRNSYYVLNADKVLNYFSKR